MDELNHIKIKKTTPYYNLVRKVAFPSAKKIIVALVLINVLGSILAFGLMGRTVQSVLNGIVFGILVLTVPSLLADAALKLRLLKGDPLFYLRRCLALSLFSSFAWIIFLFVGVPIAMLVRDFVFPRDPFFLGLFAILPIRTISIVSMSSASIPSRLTSSILQPTLCLIAAALIVGLPLRQGLILLSASALIAVGYVSMLLYYMENRGFKKIGGPPLKIFKAFLADWLEKRNDLFESYLEQLGVYQPTTVTLIGFSGRAPNRLKGLMVVTNIHPGPFLNVGSSALPYLLQKVLENRTGAIAAVPHGVSGHESNLVSQKENERVIFEAVNLLNNPHYRTEISPFTRAQVGSVKTACQAFGDLAILTITRSPKDMEDIPMETGLRIKADAEKYFADIALIDAHNCIDKLVLYSNEELEEIKESASMAVHGASRGTRSKFRVGVSKVILDEYTLSQGIGPGGIVVFLVEVEGKEVAYVVIDGNNMKTGLREKIMNSIREMSVHDGEIMTTDTHMVNGLVTAKLGYHPVGEAVDEDHLIQRIRDAVELARRDLEEGEVFWNSTSIRVKTLGTNALGNLTEFVYGMAKIVAASLIPIILISTIVTFIILL